MRDSYSDEETELLYGTRQPQQVKPWDIFKDPPTKVNSASMQETKWIDKSIVALKYLTYIVTFLIVLGTAVISKGTLLFATSQITQNITRPYCNRDLGRNQQFIVTIPDVERVAWMWVLMFIYFVPEIGTFIRSVRICVFKSWRRPTGLEFLMYFVTESLPCIGNAIFVFAVLPDLDVIKGAMLTNAVCIVPGIVSLISRNLRNLDGSLKMTVDIASIVAQATPLVMWLVVEKDVGKFTIPLSVILISFGWWENFVYKESPIPFLSELASKIKKFENSRYLIYIFLSLWKCLLFFCTTLLILYLKEGDMEFLFSNLPDAFMDHAINVTEVVPIVGGTITSGISDVIQTGNGTQITTDYMTPLWVFIINFLSNYACYATAKFTCRILIQSFSYAFSVNLAIPVTLSGLIAMCGLYVNDECFFYNTIPSYLFFNSPNVYQLKDFISQQYSWLWLLWLLSQTWITIHIWTPSCERLAKTERLFVKPLYDAFLIDQSLALNRRRDDKVELTEEDDEILDDDDSIIDKKEAEIERIGDTIPRIYCCGTMWHETEDEMMEFLKSIMRLDEDQCSRRIVRNFMGFDIPDYYELETHIFFDDAFVKKNKDDKDPHVNDYVQMLVSALDKAASEVHQTRIRIRAPKLYITPYGGRIVWTLPGKTKMIAHLKDKTKIRAKKRWSQVMYMYYLLGHRLMEREDLSPIRKNVIAENTYLLALDGDIDFQPKAVHILLYRMKKNKTLAAACGRIHPIGEGPMVWYQMFEYAIGHWLQKATEHVIGCVLCSPGCFSLFRGQALMDDNVMKKYTTKSDKPLHYVQYDQGEDRWLCTLLLQRGYRVEYSAASDAYTHCPESFNEFYNQRRRWVPSTTLNILDLLMDYKRTVKINDNISFWYIVYQVIIMVGTVLGPGTIFLMLVGAFVSAFQLDQWSSFLWNVVPILIFLFVCAVFESNIQLFFAGILSAMYGLVMMAVLIGILLQIEDDGFLAPSSLFFFCVAGEMIITAILHFKEFNCLKYGVVYYVTVPSMYMLLIIYSVFNMNNVSWGTREATVKEEDADEKKPETASKPEQQNKILSLISSNTNHDNGSMEFSLAGLFKCMLCTYKSNPPENEQLRLIQSSLEGISRRLDNLERQQYRGSDLINETSTPRRRTTVLEGARASRSFPQPTVPEDSETSDIESTIMDEDIEANSWLYDGELARGEIDILTTREDEFWKGLIEKYLYPIDDDENKKRKEEIKQGLKDLRDKAVMAFFMINALFVLVVFLLTLKKDLIHIKWPLDVKYNFTYNEDSGEIRLSKTHLELEPIGLVFVFFFAILLVVQFICMLYHRFGTFSEILLTTSANFWCFGSSTNAEKMTNEEILDEDPVQVAKKLQKLKGLEDMDENKQEEAVGRRKTAYNLAMNSGKAEEGINDLDLAFRRRYAMFQRNEYTGPVRRETLAAIDRRITVRRQTQANIQKNLSDNLSLLGHDNRAFIEETYGRHTEI